MARVNHGEEYFNPLMRTEGYYGYYADSGRYLLVDERGEPDRTADPLALCVAVVDSAVPPVHLRYFDAECIDTYNKAGSEGGEID